MSNQVARTLYEQMGAGHIHGAVNLTGGRHVVLGNDNRQQGWIDADEKGFISTDNGLMFRPNVRSRRVKFIVVLQPNDTYTIFLWKGYTNSKVVRTGKIGEVVYQLDHVYFDQLIDVIDEMYVKFLDAYEDGFIPC